MKKTRLINKAKKLRQQGYSIREISEKLGLSKSTASVWLRKVEILAEGKKRLSKIKVSAIEKSKAIKKQQKENYLKQIALGCKVFQKKIYSKEELKIFLALLFWGEGSKRDRRLVFMNSDAELILTYLTLLRSAYDINEEKLRATLHLHSYHNKKDEVDYWSKVTKIRIEHIGVYNKKNSGIRKKDGNRGCISIRYGDVRILDELLLIIRRFSRFIFAGVG